MIKKTLAITIILLVLHGIFVKHRPQWGFSQHFGQDNAIKAQRLIYDDSTLIENVLVGTSMSMRLIKDSLPHIYNLAFEGGSIFNELAILKNKTKLPKIIFIEMNVVLHQEDKSFTESLLSPVLFPLRKFFPQLRDEYQPVGIVSNVIITNNIIKRSLLRIKRIFFSELNNEKGNKTVSASKHEAAMKALSMQVQIDSYSQAIPSELFNEQFNALKELISFFEHNGVKIVFFELPVHEKLCFLSKAKKIREGFYKNFPPDKFTYVKMPDCSQYETGDGVHLSPESARKYSSYFKKEISTIRN